MTPVCGGGTRRCGWQLTSDRSQSGALATRQDTVHDRLSLQLQPQLPECLKGCSPHPDRNVSMTSVPSCRS
jgi:hypothetical protein